LLIGVGLGCWQLSSETAEHDELDFEFLGNASGEPYVLQTNVFSGGIGGREQRIYLWFDPTADFHTYTVSWTRKRAVFLVDGLPIRVFSNNEAAGIPYLSRQPMRVFSSIWNGDSWATRGGLDKIDWTHAPFIATYRNFRADACIASSSSSNNINSNSNSNINNNGNSNINSNGNGNSIDSCLRSSHASASNSFDASKLRWIKRNFMVYDYCTDRPRYPRPPPECHREL
jgi:beta-glucanase (GH16 family)